MQKNKPLYRILVKQAMPKVMAMALLVSIVLFVSFFFFIKDQLNTKHRGQLEQIENIAMTNINNVATQVLNLSNNDLIINSLIDFEQRENYLSIFFQSLKITDSPDVSIGFLDFNADPIVVKNWQVYEEKAQYFDWQPMVFESAKLKVEVSEHGVLIAAPVLYGNLPEGAIIVYIKSLQDLVTYSSSLGVQVLVNDEYEVLFSSKPGVIPVGSTVSRAILSKSYYVQSDSRWWRGFSVENLTKAYQDVLQLFVMVFFLLMVVIFATNYSARISAKIASQALRSLKDNIAEASKGRSPINQPISSREPQEIAAIKQSFNFLLHDLLNTSLSRDRFESVINSMQEPLLVLDNDRNVVVQNKSMVSFSKKHRISLPEDFSEIFPENSWQLLLRSGEIELDYQLVESRLLVPLVIKWRINEFVSDGNAIGHVLIATDLTSQKGLAFDLQIKNKAIDEASTAIVLCDMRQPDQPVSYANKAFYEMTGYSPEEVIGKNCRMLQGPKTEIKQRLLIREKIAKRETLDTTILNYKKDGTEFSNNLILSPIISSSGELTHYIGFQHDVTEQQRTASYLRKAKEKAEQSAKMKSEFLASMSHEIRTPMNGVIGTLSLMLEEELNAQQREYAMIAKDSADSLLTLINDILDFSKIEAGKLDIETSRIDLTQLTESVVRSFQAVANEKSLALEATMTDIKAPIVLGDNGRLRQVLTNVIGNAIKFTSKGSVSIKAETIDATSGQVRCLWTVKDTGVGISAERIDAIFDTFTQADSSTTRQFGGTGLGLSISKKLCLLMDGDIEVSSSLGHGSEFRFWVTLSTVQDDNAEIADSETQNKPNCIQNSDAIGVVKEDLQKQQASVDEQKSVTKEKADVSKTADDESETLSTFDIDVLLVEDNVVNQMVAKKMLSKFGMYVEVAPNGKMALERLNDSESGVFDLVFMDCHMPVMDGYETTHAIRSGDAGDIYRNIPIIAMTANAMKGDKEKCFEAGMDDYLSKPVDPNVLKHKLTTWVNKLGDED